MRSGIPRCVVAAAIVAGVLVCAGASVRPASAAFPGSNGKIAFDAFYGTRDIRTVEADGSNPAAVTSGGGNDLSPVWSADGSKIVFASNRDHASGEIYAMNADGSGVTRLTSNTAIDDQPAWSADGTKIVFVSRRDALDAEIYVMDADGSDQTRLTSSVGLDFNPAWSPDGSKIAFNSNRTGNHEIFVMNTNGTGVTNLTNDARDDTTPDWSPDGTKLVFDGSGASTTFQSRIFVMDADGSNEVQLTTGGGATSAAWSPDGTRIAFAKSGSIWVMAANGSGQTNLTNSDDNPAAHPDWQPAQKPVVTGVSPATGSTAGGTSVAITGSSFTGATAVSFGGTAAASFTVDSATRITAVTRARAAGTVDVSVTTPNGTSTNTAADDFTFAAPPPAAPVVSGLSPTSGQTSGGTSVTITGSSFGGASQVSFGSKTATSFTVDSATQITATTPAHAAGVVSVGVTTAGGTSVNTAADDFTYIPPPPAVSGIAPSNGPTSGGTSVTVTGSDLAGATSVTFGGTPAAGFTVDSATRITATSPARPAGTASVLVTTPGGTSADTAADDFAYIGLPPAISGLAPISGSVAGGTSVTISGDHFGAATSVRFGDVAASAFTVESATRINAVAPPHAAGTVDVSVTTGNGTSANTAADDFTFSAAPRRDDSADLEVALTGPRILVAGRPGAFTVSLSNRGPGTATGVRVDITLPAQLSVDSITSAQGQCSGPAPAICRFEALEPGFAGTIELRVSPSGSGDGILSTAIGGAEADPDTSNQTASLPISVGCARSFTLDTVTVTAECIASEGELLVARGDVRFGNGARILTAGTQDSAPLLIDSAAHTIRLAPLDGGGARSGVLLAGTREIVAGSLVVHTAATGDANSGLTGLAWVAGGSDLRVKLSSWAFLNSLASTLVYLVPSAADGGALVVGRLAFPFYVKNYEGLLSLQVRSNGTRTMRAGRIRLGEFLLPGTPFQMKEAELAFLDGGDTFRGKGIFGSRKLLGELIVDPVVVKDGKLRDFRAVYDGTGCKECGPKDPGLAPPPKEGEKPDPGKIVIRLVYAELNGVNLQNVKYQQPPSAGASLNFSTAPLCMQACPPPPQVNGKVVVSALDNKVVGIGQFTYKLSGRLTMDGKIFFAPAIPSSFTFPKFAQGVAPYADFLRHAVEFAEAHAVFDPPMFWVEGSWRVDQTGFIRANFGLGFDPPHFTGEGGVEFRVPENSPIFPGKSLGGAQGLVSDRAGAAQATVKVCAPKWLGGDCISYFVGAALLWHSLNFQFGHNVDDYRTVGDSTVKALGERGVVRSAIDSFVVAPGLEFAAIRLRGAQGVPDVRLESPAVAGRRLSLTLAGSDDPGNATGGLAYAVPNRNEVVFVVAKPPAGTWRIDTRGGVAVTAVELGRGLPDPELSPISGLPANASRSVELRWETTNPGRGATVDLWAERTGEASILVAAEQPATGSTTWRLDRVPAGNYAVKATLSRNGVPLQTRFWPGIVGVTDLEGPPPPARAEAIAAAPGAHVRWTPAAGAETYRIVARPVPASAGEVVELGVQASVLGAAITLAPGLRYAVAVQTVDSDSRRSPEIAAGVVEVGGAAAPPLLAGEPPNGQLGAPWGFVPVIDDIGGRRVALRLVRGPRGMRVRGQNVLWTPRTHGRHTFVLEARNDAGRARRMTFSVLVAQRGTALAAPARGIAVRPTSVTARRTTTLTLAAGRIGAATVLLDGRPVASRRIDAQTRRITVRCLRAGVHRLEIRRADGTRAVLRRAFTVVGPGC